MRVDPADRRSEAHDGVLVVGHRSVTGPAVSCQPQPRHPLLRGLQEVRAGRRTGGCGRIRDAEASDLTYRLADTLEHLRVVFHDPMAAEHSPCLLIGEEAEDQVTWWLQARSCEMAEIGQDHGVHILHIDRATPPDTAVPDLGGEGIHLPVGCVRRHHVQVSMDRQSRTSPVRTLNADKDIGAPWCALDIPWIEPEPDKLLHDVRCAGSLARAGTIAVVAGVDLDEIAADADNFSFGSQGVRHGLNPSWRFGSHSSRVLSFPLVTGAPTGASYHPVRVAEWQTR